MRTVVFSTKPYEQPYLEQANAGRHQLIFEPASLSSATAHLAAGAEAVSIFTNDDASAPVLEALRAAGVRHVAVRAAGHDQVALPHARHLGLRVANVPEYSPYSVAEHAVALMLALNRRLRQADYNLRNYDFRLDGLVGFDMNGKTVGIVGCGRIGGVLARILHGFGCRLLGYDPAPNAALTERYGLAYTSLEEVFAQSDIVSIHAPLNEHTRHFIGAGLLQQMKPGAMLINTGRGGVLDTEAAIAALRSGHLGALGLDVYEHEKGLFFFDHSHEPLPADDTFARLLAFKNVLITGHQAFLTREALQNIADTTVEHLNCWARREASPHEL
ncbi:2-hydroxyacid dehydrogenase [Hymenobacter latericus]|uniref:2-hydroxyacid dehydrogenase n=1 Tax=Hymenobacter sp. YIM 151858-1 TaxID=2987688 RepID=UPI002225D87C|nr:2-hydroxyacid dehydrogenase [Hymenobacter sp. YIM 151858-1]UYZ57351.1 2-hydroxyacid dehydrogenase [Hymenobacter sp. YIM 151858-1]